MDPETIFEARNLVFRYREQTAIDGLSLAVGRGERVAILGANGSGKSTLLRVLDGLATPSAGELRFRGELLTAERLRDLNWARAFRRQVGFIFQNADAQLFNPTVFDELAFGPLQLGLSKEQIRRDVETALEHMDLTALRDRSPHRLSGGEKKRVAIASVLVTSPEVLLLDEPTTSLDPASQSGIVDLLASWSGGSKTVVVATHDLHFLEAIADRCVLLERGRVAGEGPPMAILHDVPLLQRTGLLHPLRHRHGPDEPHPHPHIHQ